MRLVSVLSTLLLFVSQLFAGTKEFHDVLHTVEGSCGINHSRMPFVNAFVNLCMRFSDDQQAKELKDIHFAVFDLNGRRAPDSPVDLQERISQTLGHAWIAYVRVHSK